MAKRRTNCWEFHRCGLEPGGEHAQQNGVCPAALTGPHAGMNGGFARGRCCWLVPGTLCPSLRQVPDRLASRLRHCLKCEFLQMVDGEEGRAFVLLPPIGAELDRKG